MSSAGQSSTGSPCASPISPSMEPERPHPRQPLGFYVICLVVACERWAAYTLSSLAVLMLSERYGYSHAQALRLTSLANAASYLGVLPGGIVADTVLGRRRALAISTIILTLGYAALVSSRALALVPALLLLVAGSALFKPSTQAVLVSLYPPRDHRLEVIQTWFYMAANAGAASGALAAGIVARREGWSTAFALAAAAMLTACALVASSRRALRAKTVGEPERNSEQASVQSQRRPLTVAALIFAMLAYTVCAAQVEGSLLLWAQERTNRVVSGFEIPAAWFVALPALLVVVLGTAQLVWLPRIQRRSDLRKIIALGLLVVGLAFLVLLPASATSTSERIGMGWLVGAMILLVVGELLVAPLGLAQVLRLLPPRHCGSAVGGWYVSGAMGHWLAGEIGARSLLGAGEEGLLVLVVLPAAGAMVLCLSWLVEGS